VLRILRALTAEVTLGGVAVGLEGEELAGPAMSFVTVRDGKDEKKDVCFFCISGTSFAANRNYKFSTMSLCHLCIRCIN